MTQALRRSTVYFEPELHTALRTKSALTSQSLSDLVNEAVRASLSEDHEDLADIQQRVAEPTISYEALLDQLKAHGKL